MEFTAAARIGFSDLMTALKAPKGAAVAVKEIEDFVGKVNNGEEVFVTVSTAKGWAATIVALSASNADLAARIPRVPDWTAIEDKLMSELTPAQQDDAHELWMRNNLSYWGPKVEFLLKRLDEARGVKQC